MRTAIWLAVGTGLGFVAAHVVSRTPWGARFFDSINVRAAAVRDAARTGYAEREAELRTAIDSAEATVADLDRRRIHPSTF